MRPHIRNANAKIVPMACCVKFFHAAHRAGLLGQLPFPGTHPGGDNSGSDHVFSCCDELTGNGHSVYLWESQARTEEFFSPAFTQHFREAFGVEPTVTHLDILVLVDNRAGGDVVANQA